MQKSSSGSKRVKTYFGNYRDIESDKIVVSFGNDELSTDSNISYQQYGSVESFLLASGNIKNSYTGEDVRKIKAEIVEKCQKEEANKIFEKTN